MAKFTPPQPGKLADPDLDRFKKTVERQIKELQAVPIVGGILYRNVELPDGQTVILPHNFGRRAFTLISPPNASFGATTGRIRNPIDTALYDPNKMSILKAQDWGETIYVDVMLF